MSDISLKGALAEAARKCTRRILLLGNGFSIRCWGRFNYPRLADTALKEANENHEAPLFQWEEGQEVLLDCNGNFEAAIQHFNQKGDAESATVMREAFLNAVTQVHPANRGDVKGWKLKASRKLLRHFIASDARYNLENFGVFTLNYDLLLQWSLFGNRGKLLLPGDYQVSDHFGGSYNGRSYNVNYGGKGHFIWRKADSRKASIFYLHGALHFWEAGVDNSGGEVRKLKGYRNASLVKRIRDSLGEDTTSLPLTVAEGSSDDKLRKIKKDKGRDGLGYLHWTHERLRERVADEDGCVFVYGWSFREAEDEHIFETLAKGNFTRLYVGLHKAKEGDPKAMEVRNRVAVALRERRKARGGPDFRLKFFDAADLDNPDIDL